MKVKELVELLGQVDQESEIGIFNGDLLIVSKGEIKGFLPMTEG
jgi:hypothetical protein